MHARFIFYENAQQVASPSSIGRKSPVRLPLNFLDHTVQIAFERLNDFINDTCSAIHIISFLLFPFPLM